MSPAFFEHRILVRFRLDLAAGSRVRHLPAGARRQTQHATTHALHVASVVLPAQVLRRFNDLHHVQSHRLCVGVELLQLGCQLLQQVG